MAVATPLLFLAVVVLALPRLTAARTSHPSTIGAADFAARPVAEDRLGPGFNLPSLAGPGSISLRSTAGSVVVLNIWASWCPPCRVEAPHLEQAWMRYSSRDVRF